MNIESNNNVTILDLQESIDQEMKNKIANITRNRRRIFLAFIILLYSFFGICGLFYITMRRQIEFFLYGVEDYLVMSRAIFFVAIMITFLFFFYRLSSSFLHNNRLREKYNYELYGHNYVSKENDFEENYETKHGKNANQSLLIESEEKNYSIDDVLRNTKERIEKELLAVARRVNYSLINGMGIAFLGAFVLIIYSIYLWGDSSQISVEEQVLRYVPKATLVILLETLAFFFFRLYKTSLNEVKFYQNELTNIEQRTLAIKLMVDVKDTDCLDLIIKSLMATERNFILSKGQSTVFIEQERLGNEIYREVMKGFLNKRK